MISVKIKKIENVTVSISNRLDIKERIESPAKYNSSPRLIKRVLLPIIEAIMNCLKLY